MVNILTSYVGMIGFDGSFCDTGIFVASSSVQGMRTNRRKAICKLELASTQPPGTV